MILLLCVASSSFLPAGQEMIDLLYVLVFTTSVQKTSRWDYKEEMCKGEK